MKQSSDYIDFILDKFSSLDVVTARRMFGGYVLHMAGRVLGFVFDDTFLFEPGPTIDRLLPDAPGHFFRQKNVNVVYGTGSTIDKALNTAHIGDDVKCESIEGLYEKYGRYAENYSLRMIIRSCWLKLLPRTHRAYRRISGVVLHGCVQGGTH